MTPDQRNRLIEAVAAVNVILAEIKEADGPATLIRPYGNYDEMNSRVVVEITTGVEKIGAS